MRAADCVVIVTNHTAYDYAAILREAKLIVDTRNALGASRQEQPESAVRLSAQRRSERVNNGQLSGHRSGRFYRRARDASCCWTAAISVVGVDNLNDAYDVRDEVLAAQPPVGPRQDFTFHQLDISDRRALESAEFAGQWQAGRVWTR